MLFSLVTPTDYQQSSVWSTINTTPITRYTTEMETEVNITVNLTTTGSLQLGLVIFLTWIRKYTSVLYYYTTIACIWEQKICRYYIALLWTVWMVSHIVVPKSRCECVCECAHDRAGQVLTKFCQMISEVVYVA